MFTKTGGLLHAVKFYLCDPSRKMPRTKMEIPCAACVTKMVLGNTWIYLNNCKTLATTQQYERRMIMVQLAASKQRQKRKMVKSNDCNKKPRK